MESAVRVAWTARTGALHVRRGGDRTDRHANDGRPTFANFDDCRREQETEVAKRRAPNVRPVVVVELEPRGKLLVLQQQARRPQGPDEGQLSAASQYQKSQEQE